jgi:hypothetical protein
VAQRRCVGDDAIHPIDLQPVAVLGSGVEQEDAPEAVGLLHALAVEAIS